MDVTDILAKKKGCEKQFQLAMIKIFAALAACNNPSEYNIEINIAEIDPSDKFYVNLFKRKLELRGFNVTRVRNKLTVKWDV